LRRDDKKQEENLMERTYKKIEIVGISETSFGEATQNAVAKAVSHSAVSTGSRGRKCGAG